MLATPRTRAAHAQGLRMGARTGRDPGNLQEERDQIEKSEARGPSSLHSRSCFRSATDVRTCVDCAVQSTYINH